MFTLSTMNSYMVKSRFYDENISIQNLTKEVMEVFQIEEEQLGPILDGWFDTELVRINNIIVDAQYLMYGVDKGKSFDSYKEYIGKINELIEKE